MDTTHTPHSSSEPAVLTSWKEVAAYLGKGVRTVQRWEQNDGLPIRRIAGTSKIVVMRNELDRWLNAQPARTLSEQPLPAIRKHLERSKELRDRNRTLRKSVRESLEQLIVECRRMSEMCAEPMGPGNGHHRDRTQS